MSPLALAFLLLAALLHVSWNILIKRAADRQATLWWALVIAGLLLSPALASSWPPPPEAVAIALASSIFETLYFVTLVAAYELGDLSLVYPVARGSAPLLIALWAAMLLGERPSAGGWAGIGLVVAGLLLIGLSSRSETAPGPHRTGLAVGLALATGLCISGYSTINKLGVSYVSAAAFTAMFHLGTAAMLAPFVIRARSWTLLKPWKSERHQTALAGMMVGGASVLVMAALALERAAYVGAVREVSVVMGALSGWLLLGEPLGLRRTLAAVTMFVGLGLIATLG
jgi:drug/metabolite transporter (DMT)-like permease